MSETQFFRLEETAPPRLRFYVEDLQDLGQPIPIDARFAMMVILDAFRVMDGSGFAQEDQPIDAWEVHRRVENHPRRADFLRWTALEFLLDAKATSALASELVLEVVVDERSTMNSEGEAYETAMVSVRVREADLLHHCVQGFNWASAL
jgi:hypothetical protein